MADFYESFLQFAVRCERDGERDVRERMEERVFFFFFWVMIIICTMIATINLIFRILP
jgi:hypothetical protein